MTNVSSVHPPELPSRSTQPFAYLAQTAVGESMSGTIDAADLDDARRKLMGLNLRVLELRAEKPPRTRRLGSDDIIAFNQQLAQLARAGMPLEYGLRLIAHDMRRGGMAATIKAVAAELESGTPVGEAFDRHASRFPPLYGRMLQAGVQANNLPGMLMNIGRHLELVYRLRATLWRAISYPLMVLVAMALLMVLLGVWVIPQFATIFLDFRTEVPAVTQVLISISDALPIIGLSVAGLIVVLPIVWMLLRAARLDLAVADAILLPLPLIGPVLKRNLIARWCDTLRMGVDAGLDLPSAIELTGQAVYSRPLRADGRRLIDALAAGQSGPVHGMRLLPATVPAAIAFSAQQDQLSQTLASMTHMYQEQAELRLVALPAVLTPLLLLLMALIIGFVMLGLLAPMIAIINAVAGP